MTSCPPPAAAAAAPTAPSISSHLAEENDNQQQQQQHQHDDDDDTSILRIDGSMGEGGGQILRNAISFATLFNKHMIINNIRSGRSQPGLKAQHVASLQLPVEIHCFDYHHADNSVDKNSEKHEKEKDLINDNDDADTPINKRQPSQSQQQSQEEESHFSKRPKDNNNNGKMRNSSDSIIQNDQQSTPTTTTTTNRSSTWCASFLMGDSLHSQEIHFQPPPPPTSTKSTTMLNNHENEHEQQHQHDDQHWTISKDIGTAGSICLLLQAALPCAIFKCLSMARTIRTTLHLHLHGGTNATLAPQYDYWELVFLPTLQEQCFNYNNNNNNSCLLTSPIIHAQVIRRGYYPRGGGHVCITIQSPSSPAATAAAPSLSTSTKSSFGSSNVASSSSTNPSFYLHPIQLTERGHVKHIYIRSYHAGRLPRHLAESMAKAAEKLLRKTFPSSSSSTSLSSDNNPGDGRGRYHPQPPQQHVPKKDQSQQQGPNVDIVLDIVTEPNAVGSGLGILIVATTTTGCRLAGSALSNPKTKAADVGRAAAQELLDTLHDGGCVDEWLQDQLIIYMALAKGVSEIKTGSLTLHTRTAIAIAQVFCGAKCFEIHKLNGRSVNDDDTKSKKQQATNERLCNGLNDDDIDYGQKGRIPGQHLIRCHGIGHTVSPLDYA